MSQGIVQGQVAVVTGGARGIGARIATRLAEEGADLAVVGRDAGTLAAIAGEVESLGRRCLPVVADLRSQADVDAMAQRVLVEFGRVDVLVNNSGIAGPSAVLWESDPAQWEETLAVNVVGAYRCCRAFLPTMTRQRSGSVVFIGSMTGKRPLHGRTPYAASKLALVGLARTLALETGPFSIRVNVVSPGAVEGERIEWVFEAQSRARGVSVDQVREEFVSAAPLGRLVRRDDVADAVLFLVGPHSGAITGADVNVSCGATMY